ncbi:MAG TPA: HAD-IA family hydrolase, partial [Amphiplicatus sp.]|nr:HAD-IA family hydrolase [Amphiplicatus sp.]
IESSKAGVRKPEPRIYEMMCEALSVAPPECVFIDDLGINLKPAQAMGMRTIKAPMGDPSPAIEELRAALGLDADWRR